MKIFGLTISRTKAAVGTADAGLQSLYERGGWRPIIREPFTGAWQRNMELSTDTVLTYSIIWACLTLIAGDISKLWIKLIERDQDGIWNEVENSAYSPVLRKPNRYQNRIKFIECWILSKLIWGNAYILKQRDQRNVVEALYILDPSRVKVLVAPDGSVFYRLSTDHLSGIDEDVTVPASEIIHDVHVPLYHPLCGISPISACGLAAMQGLRIQNSSEKLFANNSQPGGVLTAPGLISNETAQRLRDEWQANFTGDNTGKIAVLGDGLKYEAMAITAKDAQLVDQLKLTGDHVCAAFHVPGWKVGIAPMPAYGNVQAANIDYYSQALQGLIENVELCLDEGLGLSTSMGIQFDLDALLRMDSLSQMEIQAKGVGAGIFAPNESRATFDRKPVAGGEIPYMQEQNWPLKLLSMRELPTRPPTAPTQITPEPPAKNVTEADSPLLFVKAFREALAA